MEYLGNNKKSMIIGSDGKEKEYYTLVISEQWSDHTVMWHSFLVRIDFEEIFWENFITGKVFTLKDWRDTLKYKEQINKINDYYSLK